MGAMDRAAVAAVTALDDDVRRALYAYVRGAGAPVTREAAAAATGISRKLAAFHLDKLVALGLLRCAVAAAQPRRVGRAPLLYEPAPVAVRVQVPERSPELIAELLLAAIAEQRPEESAEQAALRVARERGRELGAQARAELRGGRLGTERAVALAERVLADLGFEPYRADATVRLRNCPFDPLAAARPQLVCGLNCQYLRGVLEGMDAADRVVAELAPQPGECCVRLSPAPR
jgi:predicted ArsR family transcriptional regulator